MSYSIPDTEKIPFRLNYDEFINEEEHCKTYSIKGIIRDVKHDKSCDSSYCHAPANLIQVDNPVYMVIAYINSHDTPCRRNNKLLSIHTFVNKQKAIDLRNTIKSFEDLHESLDRAHLRLPQDIANFFNEWRAKNGFPPVKEEDIRYSKFLNQLPFFDDNGDVQFFIIPWFTYDASLGEINIVKRIPFPADEEDFL